MQPLAVGADSAGRKYYLVTSDTMCISALPWTDSQFDALMFVDSAAKVSDIESALRKLVAANTDWIFTTGSQAEVWHDQADQLGMQLGRQRHVGDGSPMTAWLEDMSLLEQWRTSHNFGNSDYFLFVVVGSNESIDSLAKRLNTDDQ
jgi:hypothetical protein